MRVLLVAVCLIAVFAGGSCEVDIAKQGEAALKYLSRSLEKVKESKDFVLANLKTSVKGDPSRCINDYTQMTSEHFQECSRKLEAFSDVTHINRSVATSFCQERCSTFLAQILYNYIHDCDVPSNQIPLNESLLLLLNKTCDYSPQREYCILAWSDTPNDNDYINCISEFSGIGPCPDSCKRAEQWVVNDMGCCYRALLDYSVSTGDTSDLLTSNFWNACGVKEPQGCHQ